MPVKVHRCSSSSSSAEFVLPYDESTSQKFITSVAEALGRPYRTAPKAPYAFHALRDHETMTVHARDQLCEWRMERPLRRV
eukprot:scaffold210638_cov29-Tisochrysis_lutea.AAC.2